MSKKSKNAIKSNGNHKKSKNYFLTFLKVVGIILAVFAILTAAGWIMAKSLIKPPEIPPLPTAQPPAATEPPSDLNETAFTKPESDDEDLLINKGLHAPEGFTSEDRKNLFFTFVIIGIDGGGNTDTIMVASYDGVNMEANIIGIPRDSLVNVKRRVKKINAAYPAGTLNGGGQSGGADQLKREIKTIIGFTPDFFVSVDMEAFVRIVDAVDGIEVEVPFDMKYTDPEQGLHIDIKQGSQLLYGADALKFARYRKGDSGYKNITDYDRINNQQAVISALVDRMLNPANLLKLPLFVDIFNDCVYFDINAENLLWFADQINNIRGTDSLHSYTLPTTGTSGSPDWYEYLDKSAIIELVNKTINPYTKDIEPKDVDIIGG